MVWSAADERFQENLEAAKAYYEQHWTLCVPRSATMLDRPVGQWLSNLRHAGALEGHPEWKAALEAVDEHWDPAWPAEWQRYYAALRELLTDEENHYDARGHVEALPDGSEVKLGVFLSNNRSRRAKLTTDKLQALAALGLEWAATEGAA
ncbi:helicase associated domain-containing protein [Streptomyces celluloflavus]|uniref:helicase associated domain-containing protein n=1 Tax=Streptomyces celluloflavus TaxID=58344 RepID=UPI0036D9D30C